VVPSADLDVVTQRKGHTPYICIAWLIIIRPSTAFLPFPTSIYSEWYFDSHLSITYFLHLNYQGLGSNGLFRVSKLIGRLFYRSPSISSSLRFE
jgi:hypothetical protein